MNIGLVADDEKKKLMQNFCIAYRGILQKNHLYATGTTGSLVEQATNLVVHKYLPGALGGIEQLGVDIESNQIDLLLYLRHPGSSKIRAEYSNSIISLCEKYNIPCATNLASAEVMVLALDRGDLDWREMYK